MTRSVSGKAGKAGALGQARDHFRPQDEGEWGTGIASRFRAKQGPLFCTELAALLKIGFKKAAGDAAVAYHSLRTVLARNLDHLHRTQYGGRPVSLPTSDLRFRSSGHVHAAVSHGLLYTSGFRLGRTH